MSSAGPKILLVVGGGIAAYKSCELVRLIRKGGGDVTCVLTQGGQQFVTPMALAALSENEVHTTLWDLKNEAEMGHIQLSREADLVVVCPATADLMAKMAAGIADDLATTLILATDKPVMIAPAMNVRMWEHEATQRNLKWLQQAGVNVLHPDEGAMACGEFGYGRLPEPEVIWAEIAGHFGIEVEVTRKTADVAPTVEEEVPEAEDEIEAIEPEPAPKGGGLGGLLASIIPRSTAKRSAEEIEAEYLEEEEAAAAAEDAEAEGEEQICEASEEEELAQPDLDAGPLLAKKGGASSAPPTDPEAINHTVKTGTGDAEPEPIEGDDFEGAPPARPEDVEVAEEDALGGESFKVKKGHQPLKGKHMLVTAGPTWEAIDPVRYIANRSSGKQGFAIAAAAAALGAKVTLVAGPVSLRTPDGVDRVDVESAVQMSDAVKKAMPADIAVMVAAVADWRPKEYRDEKMKKRGSAPPALVLEENPDILTNVAASDNRPKLVVGFAAETEDLLDNAKRKRKRKAADWIVANDVSGDVMGGDLNTVQIVREGSVDTIEEMPKMDVAMALVEKMAEALAERQEDA
ncbi:bifunctional phosphopantothenoylcysteine decarboxylase/phosphopantothenate synthase [Altererythrobacter sp.]|uniref:bifunctional phosphopantothenoylcysteine decarboxylase/phosphopantothenate synthase n=1 Tax=Altererythrobacter sp. TaxID=1872480 RepID=UPI001B010080|nr:bifunctional phosphopantothenoylcysteine decarboxylase/phosphopantothenate synthase [Altererythrobacter sp.]MBO6610068.1 bifunctional phosphopantothenoylcysteine decarboxylase/phosphopantothenate synthase [Altererythrobacter sp.]MBO6642694.1 bifunctional phosphopantothenoylcysteine decarboxylase/phosphopantothenate synthase [Altererythrobacter sp.]MBO6708798.1 bifunctional phosphopantothenoylcysteine decarboxylase/phosphopantothenate synthase [Altererythrobacter sp.]MBO6945094.1 bifunctional